MMGRRRIDPSAPLVVIILCVSACGQIRGESASKSFGPGSLEVPNQSTSPSLAAVLQRFPLDDRRHAEYAGLKIQISESQGYDRVTLRTGTKVLVRWPKPEDEASANSSSFALLPLLGQPDSQLVLWHSSAGAHCCVSYRIYDVRPTLRLLFDSDAYSYADDHGDLGWGDLDGDGVAEIVHHTAAFAYFEGPYSSSPFPPLVFKYKEASRTYRLANRTFKEILLRDVVELGPASQEDVNSILWAMLPHVFAGHADEAWKMFDRHYTKDDKAATRRAIRQTLESDSAYRELYSGN
jgi:hypothetical protein